MKKILFVDRDGTLIVEPTETEQVNSLEELRLVPGVISSLKKISEAGWELVIVTNQDGLGTPANSTRTFNKINQKMLEIFSSEGIKFRETFICPHFQKDECECRKPKVGILQNFFQREQIDLKNSFMIGDRESDWNLPKTSACKVFFLIPNFRGSIFLKKF